MDPRSGAFGQGGAERRGRHRGGSKGPGAAGEVLWASNMGSSFQGTRFGIGFVLNKLQRNTKAMLRNQKEHRGHFGGSDLNTKKTW